MVLSRIEKENEGDEQINHSRRKFLGAAVSALALTSCAIRARFPIILPELYPIERYTDLDGVRYHFTSRPMRSKTSMAVFWTLDEKAAKQATNLFRQQIKLLWPIKKFTDCVGGLGNIFWNKRIDLFMGSNIDANQYEGLTGFADPFRKALYLIPMLQLPMLLHELIHLQSITGGDGTEADFGRINKGNTLRYENSYERYDNDKKNSIERPPQAGYASDYAIVNVQEDVATTLASAFGDYAHLLERSTNDPLLGQKVIRIKKTLEHLLKREVDDGYLLEITSKIAEHDAAWQYDIFLEHGSKKAYDLAIAAFPEINELYIRSRTMCTSFPGKLPSNAGEYKLADKGLARLRTAFVRAQIYDIWHVIFNMAKRIEREAEEEWGRNPLDESVPISMR